MTSAQERKIKQTGCDARFDNLTRQLYATDASIYQIEPIGAAFPRNTHQASAVISAAADVDLWLFLEAPGTSGGVCPDWKTCAPDRSWRSFCRDHAGKRPARFAVAAAVSAAVTAEGGYSNNPPSASLPKYHLSILLPNKCRYLSTRLLFRTREARQRGDSKLQIAHRESPRLTLQRCN